MLKFTAVVINDFFEKLIFNAQCLYGTVLERPLEEKDFSGLGDVESQKSIKSIYLLLNHGEQKEILKSILGSKLLFDAIVGKFAILEANIIKWDKDMSISNEDLHDMANRASYECFNHTFKQLSDAIMKVSPSLFQKLVCKALETGLDVETIVARLGKQYRETEKQAKKLLDELNKKFPQQGGEYPPQDPPDDEGKY
jgi:hypothetical protein